MSVESLITQHIDIWTSAVQTKSTTGRGTSSKLDLYGIKKLRELILELAVRGKLVPQDPTDEPASVLLERIAQKKIQLVKEGAIPKTKSLPPIQSDDIPKDLPLGWEVIRLGNITSKMGSGSTPRGGQKAYVEKGIIFLRSQNVWNEGIKLDDVAYISCDVHEKMSNTRVQPGDVLLNITGASLGRTSIFPDEFIEANVNQHVTIIRLIELGMNKFVHIGLMSPMVQKLVWGRQVGMAIEGLSKKVLEQFEFPIPPLKEQHRIVAKVDELMKLCDQLEQQTEASIAAHQVLVETLLATLTNSKNAEELMENWQRISAHFDTLFTTEESIDQLKQTILQLAVMGKLVPQNPADEPASELLKRIAKEKAQLVKEGKIKKQKALPLITDDEKPFELPEGWAWCRVNDLCTTENGDRSKRYPNNSDLVDSGIPFFGAYDISGNKLVFSENLRFITEKKFSELSNGKLRHKDFVMLLRGSVGKTAQFESNKEFATGFINAQMLIIRLVDLSSDNYLNCFFQSKLYWDSINIIKSGAVIQQMPASKVVELLIPVPPLSEQNKISEKVDELLCVCNLLISRLRESQSTQLHLTDAIVEQVL
ncbi:restriction endonuclease subunit S [Vibrio sp.]|nr:restriction endonuclease subunit S [Vibrio sp.]